MHESDFYWERTQQTLTCRDRHIKLLCVVEHLDVLDGQHMQHSGSQLDVEVSDPLQT